MSSNKLLSLPLRTTADAAPPAAERLADAQRKNGMVPNMYAAMANAPGLLDTYLHGYDLFRKQSGFSSIEQEVVLLTISRENGCEYCMAAHSVIADGASHVPRDVTDAIRADERIQDPKLQALAAFVRIMFRTRGRPAQHDVAAFIEAGYAEAYALEIVLALAVKTISNYTNHLFDTEVDRQFAARAWTNPTAPSAARA